MKIVKLDSYFFNVYATCLAVFKVGYGLEQGWPTFSTLRATFGYLKKSAGLTYPSAPNMFNTQYIKLWQGEQTFIVLERIPVLYPELR